MSAEQNKAAMRRWIENGFNKHNLAAFDTHFSAGLVDHALPSGLPPGREGRKMLAGAFFAAFPDIHLTADDIVADDDKVVTRWTAQGTHKGDLMGIPPTGKTVQVHGIAIDRFVAGQSVEHWEVIDQMGMMQQLGGIPS